MKEPADTRLSPSPAPAPSDQYTLRLLATSDIHAAILPYDYSADAPTSGYGLACIASLVETARSEAPGLAGHVGLQMVGPILMEVGICN